MRPGDVMAGDNDTYTPRLREHYEDDIIPELAEQFSYKNKMQVPRLRKIVVNMGVGEGTTNVKSVDAAAKDLAIITGQKAQIIKARRSVAGFKLRAGMTVGCKVTLRGDRMYEFLDRLLSIALPRVRDFRGLSRDSFDSNGNYSMGIEEQLIFPEISYDEIDKVRGMDVTVVTSAVNDEEGEALLEELGFPFKAR